MGVGALVAGLVGCSNGTSGSASDTWVHAIVTPKGDSGFILMAQERKFFQKQGVKVQIKQFTGNIPLNQALASGSVDSIETAPDPIFDAAQRGAHEKIIGSTLPGLTYSLIAKSSVKSFADLKGKSIGVSQPGSLPDVAARAMLKVKGVDPKSVRAVSVGNDAQRFQALLAGRVDAVAVSPEFVPRLKGQPKLHLLAAAEDLLPNYPRFVIAANSQSLKKKPKAAVAFLAAEMEGISYATKHRDAELALSAKTLKKPASDPSVAYAYDRIIKYHASSPTCEIPTDKLNWLQQFRLSNGLQKKKININDIVDSSYRQKALTKVGKEVKAGG
ncbi:MAG: ABC transporter substrate-binding protein [Streptosporangiales bacterium]|nr:ABC transporter substrate-binding protein [Streptosporangiales bacterium]MBO0892172.1 ABC transporter substrate-binding protein [Acidothermales bacterium]